MSLRASRRIGARKQGAFRSLVAWGTVASALIQLGCGLAPGQPTAFELKVAGKVGLARGEERASFHFSLTQLQERQEWEFWGPFGRGRTHAAYERGKLEVLSAPVESDGDELQQEFVSILGSNLPFGVLASWIRFRPDLSGEPFERLGGGDGRVDAFQQFGWLVELKQLSDGPEGPRPARLVLTKEDLRLVVAIRKWEIRGPRVARLRERH